MNFNLTEKQIMCFIKLWSEYYANLNSTYGAIYKETFCKSVNSTIMTDFKPKHTNALMDELTLIYKHERNTCTKTGSSPSNWIFYPKLYFLESRVHVNKEIQDVTDTISGNSVHLSSRMFNNRKGNGTQKKNPKKVEEKSMKTKVKVEAKKAIKIEKLEEKKPKVKVEAKENRIKIIKDLYEDLYEEQKNVKS